MSGFTAIDHYYRELIRNKTRSVLEAFKNRKLKKEETAFLGLVQAVRKNTLASDELLKSITQADLDTFTDQQKSMYFEGMVLNLAAEKRSTEAIATLCRNALLHWEKAFFARRQLAMLESRDHPQKGIEQYEELLKNYPDDPDTLFAIARLYIRLRQRSEAQHIMEKASDRFRRGLYRIILDLFSNWVMYTLTFILLVLLVYTPVVSLVFLILASGFCVGLMIYAIAKRDPLIFNFFFSTILIVTVLIVVKWLFLK